MTIIQDITPRTVVRFSKEAGCPKCLFLNNTIEHSVHKDNITTIYITDDNIEDMRGLGITTAPLMAIVENGEIVERDPNVIIREQLDAFMAKL